MRYTQGQAELAEALENPVRQGARLFVLWAENGSGQTAACRDLERRTKEAGAVRIVSTGAHYGAWDAIITLARAAKTSGRSATDLLVNAFRQLSEDGARPLSVVVEDSHFLRPRDMERLVLGFERAAFEVGIGVSVCLVCKKVTCWRRQVETLRDGSKAVGGIWEEVTDWPAMPALFVDRAKTGRLTMMRLTRAGLDALSRSEAREEVRERVLLAS